jgi:hypothetical protein
MPTRNLPPSLDELQNSLLELETQNINKVMYKLLARWATGLMRMSANIYKRLLDVERRNSNQVRLSSKRNRVIERGRERKNMAVSNF